MTNVKFLPSREDISWITAGSNVSLYNEREKFCNHQTTKNPGQWTMWRLITYSLRNDAADSDAYYRTIAGFYRYWVEGIHKVLEETVKGFQAYRKELGQADRSFEECAFELLVLGVMLQEHGSQAEYFPPWMLKVLHRFIAMQARIPQAEKIIKVLRGWIVTLSTLNPSTKNKFTRQAHLPEGSRQMFGTQKRVSRLLDWMRAVDYGGQAERLAQWQAYLATVRPEKAAEIESQSLEMAQNFSINSEAILGPYTCGVNRFIEEEAPSHRWQYDLLFVSRKPVEYHLGMLGTVLLNRAYKNRFLETQRKVMILPPCMRAKPETECMALESPFGKHCRFCTTGCPIATLTQQGEKQGFEVFMIPDELRQFKSPSEIGKNVFGVVGISCALTNWSGGWDLDKENIPGQGLLLDYVGCSYHWDKHGIPTETNLHQLTALTNPSKN